jgi:hypothetical protein
MSRLSGWTIGCLVVAAINATSGQRAPVPRQVLSARAAFIGNGGGDSYGANSYFRLTKYDGGPDRAYNAFYSAVREWGHYELVGSTDEADVTLVIRFANPVVDRQNKESDGEHPNDWIYDPQLNLSINDPKTGLALWALTEHIQPGDDRAADNQHFDEAVTRLVDDLKRLNLSPDAALAEPNVPPGAVEVAIREQRDRHAGGGMLLGGIAGGLLGSRLQSGPCDGFDACRKQGRAQATYTAAGIISGAVIGALVGWVWPVSF